MVLYNQYDHLLLSSMIGNKLLSVDVAEQFLNNPHCLSLFLLPKPPFACTCHLLWTLHKRVGPLSPNCSSVTFQSKLEELTMLLPALLPSVDGCSTLLSTCALQVERLQRKFATIHSTLAQQQNNKPGPDTPRMSSLAHLHTDNSSKVGPG